jgi:hypothetical protein
LGDSSILWDGWELFVHGYLVCFVWFRPVGDLTGDFAGILGKSGPEEKQATTKAKCGGSSLRSE